MARNEGCETRNLLFETSTSRHPALHILGLILWVCLLWTGRPALAEEPGRIICLQLENDFFGGGTDRHFTHGTRLFYMTEPLPWMTRAAEKLPWVQSNEDKEKGLDLRARGTISLGQNIYTPEQTDTRRLIKDDRPYAGWLYLGFGIAANRDPDTFEQIELDVGIVGPLSYAEEVQKGWHGLLSIEKPKGWDHQLENEPGVVLFYERARQFGPEALSRGLSVDFIPHVGGSLGNVFTYGSAGFTLRIGQDLRGDFGPPRIRPSLPGAGYFKPGEAFNWYFFAGADGRAVLQNIFLDGNTFSSSHDVDKKTFVADAQVGLSFQYAKMRITYTQIFRTREFHGQDSPDMFGSLSVSIQF
jgi:hypothetical protein